MIDRKQAEDLGWNSIEHDNATGNARVAAQQRFYIASLLCDVRDLMGLGLGMFVAKGFIDWFVL
jgi:hypothetical protein